MHMDHARPAIYICHCSPKPCPSSLPSLSRAIETRLREENFLPTIPVTTNSNRLQRCLTARNISSFVSPGNWLRIPSTSEFSFNPCKWYSVKTTSMKGDTTFIRWLSSLSLSLLLSLSLCAYMNNRRSYAPFVLCRVQFDSCALKLSCLIVAALAGWNVAYPYSMIVCSCNIG